MDPRWSIRIFIFVSSLELEVNRIENKFNTFRAHIWAHNMEFILRLRTCSLIEVQSSRNNRVGSYSLRSLSISTHVLGKNYSYLFGFLEAFTYFPMYKSTRRPHWYLTTGFYSDPWRHRTCTGDRSIAGDLDLTILWVWMAFGHSLHLSRLSLLLKTIGDFPRLAGHLFLHRYNNMSIGKEGTEVSDPRRPPPSPCMHVQ